MPQWALTMGTMQLEKDELTLAAASVSTSKAWESWWKSSAKNTDQKRGENEVGLDDTVLHQNSTSKKPSADRKADISR